MKKLNFRVNDDVLKLGVKVLIAQIVGVVNSKSNREFEVYLKDELEDLKKIWRGKISKMILYYKDLEIYTPKLAEVTENILLHLKLYWRYF